MSCEAVYCASRTTKRGVKDPELTFHTFPKCPEIRLQWINAVRRENWEPKKYSRLCSKHFDKACFITGLSIRKLKTDAIPTIFEGYPVYYQQVLKKRKASQKQDEKQLFTPRLKKILQECGISTEDMPTTPGQVVKILTSLAHFRVVAERRLKIIKKIRESKRRLLKKNATLLNVINNLRTKSLMNTESLYLLPIIGNID